MNAIVSTTRSWNIGDDFIRMGVMKIMPEIVPVYFDRHPVFGPPDGPRWGGPNWRGAIESGWAEAIVVAGTPGWIRGSMPLYEAARKFGLPVYLIGIGMESRSDLTQYIREHPEMMDTIADARVVTCRDAPTASIIGRGLVLPCPAYLAPEPKLKKTLAINTPEGVNVVHQSAEADHSNFYSDDPNLALRFYERASHVITGRLHGAVVAAGAGCPQIEPTWPADNERCIETWEVVRLWEGGQEELLKAYREIL